MEARCGVGRRKKAWSDDNELAVRARRVARERREACH